MPRPFSGRPRLRLRTSADGVVGVRKRRPHEGRGRARLRRFGVARYRYLAVVPLLLALIALVAWVKQPELVTERYRPVRHSISNPLIGWAPDARTDPDSVEIPHTLVHATLSWREFEPIEGEYDFEAFEQNSHIAEWRERGVRMVLRFVLDCPGEQMHSDIPDWLMEALGEDAGTRYHSRAGQGFSPNYNNAYLQQKHAEALAALGARYNDDPFLLFIEMGSLGHDGGWWVDSDAALTLPPFTEIKNYISAYSLAFPGTKVLATSPYQSAKQIQAGLFNPFLGDADATWNWIDMATYGGYEEQIGTDLRGMGEFYLSVPSGAQISRAVSAQALIADAPERLLDQIRECHTSYISGVPATGLDAAMKQGVRLAQEMMGYRLWVRSAQWAKLTRRGENMHVSLVIRNSGVAPMSQSWPMQLSLVREGETKCAETLRTDVRSLVPGESRIEADLELPIQLDPGTYQLALSILDPATGEAAVELAMVSVKRGLSSVLGSVEVVR